MSKKNNQEKEGGNVFFGMEVKAPWPQHFPRGRLIPESGRHFTLAFLGPVDDVALVQHLRMLPKPKNKIGFVGCLKDILFLPKKQPRVVAFSAEVLFNEGLLLRYQHELVEWLNLIGFSPFNQDREWLNHVSVARNPYDEKAWRNGIEKLPFMCSKMHLYKSAGNLNYEPKWTFDFISPFEEVAHPTGVAFKIRAEKFEMLKSHAEMALSFKYPAIFEYFEEYKGLERVEQLIQHLNRAIAKADSKEGAPLKAVSFHGDIEERDDILEWEMVIDV